MVNLLLSYTTSLQIEWWLDSNNNVHLSHLLLDPCARPILFLEAVCILRHYAPAGITYDFACQCWFSQSRDDGLIEWGLLPSRQDPFGKQTSYLAEVPTCDMRRLCSSA